MSVQKISTSHSALIWFGAGVSIAEIVAGTWFAPLGWQRGLGAILLGHLIGGALFFAAAWMGASLGKSAMQSTQISFGSRGSVLFSLANVLQLIGWTAIMIYTGALVADAVGKILWSSNTFALWCVLLGVLIGAWLSAGGRAGGRVKMVSLVAMALLAVWLSLKVFDFQQLSQAKMEGELSFTTAVELAAVMPLSWLPLVADYTRNAVKPCAATWAATLAYALTSCWMYALGLAAILLTQQSDVAQIIAAAGLGVAGLLLVVLSTVSTTFLDAFSAGVSANNVCAKWQEKPVAIGVVIAGTILAMALPVTEYEHFLLLIGSVFAPMIAVMIADFFLLKRCEPLSSFDWMGLMLWLMGLILYRYLLAIEWDSFLGLTAPVILVMAALTFVVRKMLK